MEPDGLSDYSVTSSKKGSTKTREELNDIEKQRTRKLNSLILTLRSLLEASNVVTKRDKLSILKNTYDYITHLRGALHAAEERISQLNRNPSELPNKGRSQGDTALSSESGEIPFQKTFTNSGVAMALLGVDGQFLDCNDAFCALSGYTKQNITTLSLFNISTPEEMTQIFNIVGGLLSNVSGGGVRHFWKTCKFHDKKTTCFVSMWLVTHPDGEPAYFQMMAVPNTDSSSFMGDTSGFGTGTPSHVPVPQRAAPVHAMPPPARAMHPAASTASSMFLLPHQSQAPRVHQQVGAPDVHQQHGKGPYGTQAEISRRVEQQPVMPSSLQPMERANSADVDDPMMMFLQDEQNDIFSNWSPDLFGIYTPEYENLKNGY
mmetsp:Transcript_2678/g.4012  ORF Transcript_2678/g.4012 Transcript_2678/m.4012 type:complete len:375 (-) Transcript_2678:171-1295(-)|eukprot:CAMPEP_0185026872 /NCGR_PEP_ID=MMETSP1103-20130426/11432_1 /TAXON_ID=36769 /ORGANISM="Paraphysomonas bandaiensis, Strain Caron Lab Isolate" /LENGTH=374 /DNA_ID=CAMNT_0027560605 /DNA_START=31 /DNA_END=1155 /DNA_ORIENTATION=+